MHTRHFMGLMFIALVMSACGSGKPGAATPGRGMAGGDASRQDSGNATAEQVAAAARGDVSCPADATPAPSGAPVDDIVGVRPGMTYEQAANAVMCSSPLLVVQPETGRGFDMQTYGQTIRQGFSARFAQPRVQKTGRQLAQEMERAAMERGCAEEQPRPGQFTLRRMGDAFIFGRRLYAHMATLLRTHCPGASLGHAIGTAASPRPISLDNDVVA